MSVTAVPLRPIAKGSLTKLWLGTGLAVVAAVGLACVGTHDVRAKFTGNDQFLANNADEDGVMTTKSGLQYRVIRNGEGASPAEGQFTLIAYEGRLRDGTVFDKSEKAPMLVGQTIPGFDEALRLMSKGAEYEIWIPAALAYGPEDQRGPDGQVVIPGDSVLNFTVKMLEVVSKEDSQKILSGQMNPAQAPQPAQ